MQLRATRQKIESNDSHVTRTLDDVAADATAATAAAAVTAAIAVAATAVAVALLPNPATISN